MGSSDRPLSASPWTVVLQGTSLKYEDATQLDKLEYAIRIGGSSVERHCSQHAVVKGLANALCEAAKHLTNPDSLVRAGKLLNAVAEYVTKSDRSSSYNALLEGLSPDMFEPMVAKTSSDRDVSSWFLSSLGMMMGHRALSAFAESPENKALIMEQKAKYVAAVATSIADVTAESIRAHHEEEEEEENGIDEITPITAPLITESLPSQSEASSLGYIPTVSGITSMLPQGSATTADDQLGRILSGLAAFLSNDDNRYLFSKVSTPNGRGPSVLAGLLDKDVGVPVQTYYHTVFCLWLLSFVSQQDMNPIITECVSDALEEAAVPRRLTNVLREVSAEKVVRISLATLRNILKISVTLRKEMVGAGLVNALQSLCFRRWNDEDIREDLGILAEALESELASMSNFDVYRAEVLSGALEWTPVHRDEMFWQENAEKLERNQQEVLRCIVRVLHESTDETVLAVACNDLAQFIKFHPRGRIIAQSLGVKARLMELMVSGEVGVRRYALNCVQSQIKILKDFAESFTSEC